jgi:hypothetical protein
MYKKMKSYAFSFLIGGLCVLFSACEDKNPTAPTRTNFDIISSHKWTLTSWTVDPAINGLTDLFADQAPCQKDDIQTFNKNGLLEIDRGVTKCFAGEPQVDTSTRWKIEGNSVIMEFKISSTQIVRDTCELITLTDQKLEYYSSEKMNNKIYKYKWGYTPK